MIVKSFFFRSGVVLGGLLTCLCAADMVQAAKIEVYNIPKESAPGHSHGAMGTASGGGAPSDPHGGMNVARPSIKVAKLPEGWKENPKPGTMRAASYLVSDAEGSEAEVAVIPMPGMANVDLQLVNMWREQAKLPAISEAELGSQSVPVTVGGETGKLFEVASVDLVIGDKYKARILVAMLKQPDTTWFFKFSGEDAFIASKKDSFIQFLGDVSFEAPAALPAGHPPVGGGSPGGMGMGQGMMGGGATVPAGTGDQPKWEIPARWTEVARSPFLVGKFQAKGEGAASADINVSMSSGDGGGLLMNVNRWRGQLGLAAVDAAGLDKLAEPLKLTAGEAEFVDFSGAGAENSDPQRCVGVMLSRPGEAWFFKMMGSADVVAAERESFLKFVRSVKF